MIQATVTRLSGRKPYRVTDSRGRPLLTPSGKPLDRGGYERSSEASKHAAALNHAVALNQSNAAKARVTKRQRTRSRRQVKQAQRERLRKIAARDRLDRFLADA